MRKQLARYWDRPVSVFPYSTRPGFECLRERIDRDLLCPARAKAADHHGTILRHKLQSLLDQCSEYLSLASKSAERDESEREQLSRSVIGRNNIWTIPARRSGSSRGTPTSGDSPGRRAASGSAFRDDQSEVAVAPA